MGRKLANLATNSSRNQPIGSVYRWKEVPKLGITTSESDCISWKEGDWFMFPFLNLNDIAKIDVLSCSIWKCLVMLCGTQLEEQPHGW